MERVRYPHKTRGCDRITCISNGGTSACRRAASSGGPPVRNRRARCARIRHSYCWPPRIRMPMRRRYGGR
jgi:hypothetical protein